MVEMTRFSLSRGGLEPDPDGAFIRWRDVVAMTEAMKTGVGRRIANLEAINAELLRDLRGAKAIVAAAAALEASRKALEAARAKEVWKEAARAAEEAKAALAKEAGAAEEAMEG